MRKPFSRYLRPTLEKWKFSAWKWTQVNFCWCNNIFGQLPGFTKVFANKILIKTDTYENRFLWSSYNCVKLLLSLGLSQNRKITTGWTTGVGDREAGVLQQPPKVLLWWKSGQILWKFWQNVLKPSQNCCMWFEFTNMAPKIKVKTIWRVITDFFGWTACFKQNLQLSRCYCWGLQKWACSWCFYQRFEISWNSPASIGK